MSSSPRPDPGDFYRRGGGRRRQAPTLEALRRKYAPERARHPRKLHGTFQAPLDISPALFKELRLQKVRAFLEAMQAQGWRLHASPTHTITLESGASPAYDLRDQAYREGYREYVVSAWFTLPEPKPLRIALPDWFTAGLVTPQTGRD